MDVAVLFEHVLDQSGILAAILLVAVISLWRRDQKREKETRELFKQVIELSSQYEAMIQQSRMEKNEVINGNREKLDDIIKKLSELRSDVWNQYSRNGTKPH